MNKISAQYLINRLPEDNSAYFRAPDQALETMESQNIGDQPKQSQSCTKCKFYMILSAVIVLLVIVWFAYSWWTSGKEPDEQSFNNESQDTYQKYQASVSMRKPPEKQAKKKLIEVDQEDDN